jgi:hypothetical protein
LDENENKKPRTYRNTARKEYLSVAKKRRPSKKIERYLCKNKHLSTEDEKSTTNSQPSIMKLLSKLKAFRQEAHSYLVRAKDATFELMDAIMLNTSTVEFMFMDSTTSIQWQR